MKEQEGNMKKVRSDLDKSMSEFRSYVKTVFIKQDKSIVALHNECEATNDELKRQSAFFSGQLEEIRGRVSEILTAVRATNENKVPLVMQTGIQQI